MNEGINRVIKEAFKKLNKDLDIGLIEELLGLVNNKVIEVYTTPMRSEFNIDRTKVGLEKRIGVRFKGKERIIELEQKLKEAEEVIEYYCFYHSDLDLDRNKYFTNHSYAREYKAKYMEKTK